MYLIVYLIVLILAAHIPEIGWNGTRSNHQEVMIFETSRAQQRSVREAVMASSFGPSTLLLDLWTAQRHLLECWRWDVASPVFVTVRERWFRVEGRTLTDNGILQSMEPTKLLISSRCGRIFCDNLRTEGHPLAPNCSNARVGGKPMGQQARPFSHSANTSEQPGPNGKLADLSRDMG